jgi:hybrid cluster-associated redox disulfide protein
MDTITSLQSEMTVEDVLKTWPSAYTVFLNGKAECIGCFLQKFCSLREVADAYQVSLEEFIEALEKHVPTINHPQRS